MTPQQYIEWLGNEIAYLESVKLTEFGDGRLNAFKRARTEYLDVINPPEQDAEKEFTDGISD